MSEHPALHLEPTPADKVVSPKVYAAAAAGFLAPVAVAALDALTEQHVAGLGVWGSVVLAAVGALSAAIAGWAKRDPRRV